MINGYIARLFENSRKRHLAVTALLIAGGIAALSVLFTFNPASSALYAPCPFRALTGFYCPGCGSLRAIHHVLHGHLITAFGLNPLMVLSLPFLGYCFLSYVIGGIRGRSLPVLFIPPIAIWLFLGAVLLFWVLRNIARYPFSWLTP
jgi:hypothetical protein